MDNITQEDERYMVKDRELSKDYQVLLDQIAEDTGGVSYKNSLNFKHGFDAILGDWITNTFSATLLPNTRGRRVPQDQSHQQSQGREDAVPGRVHGLAMPRRLLSCC